MATRAQPFEAAMGAGCEEQSWSPEVVSLYGDGEAVLRKLGNFDMDLPHRRIYVFTIESKDHAELSLYEKVSAENVKVSKWKGGTIWDLHQRINDAILQNKGVNCVGEQTKSIVSKFPELKHAETVSTPANALAAFKHPIQEQGKNYIRATAYLLC